MKKGLFMWMPPLLLLLPAPLHALSYEDLVNRFIDNLNQKSNSRNLFRLLTLTLQSEGNNDPTIPRLLNVTIMETVCSKTEQRPLSECDFKENGLVKECNGTVFLDATRSSVDISCEPGQRGDFGHQIIPNFANFIHRKLRKLLKKFRNLQDEYRKLKIFFG